VGTACGREKIIPFFGAAGFKVSTTVKVFVGSSNEMDLSYGKVSMRQME
jgi:hypothetical protein